MTHDASESQALATSIGEHSVFHFGKENLEKLLVEYNSAMEQTTIYVALHDQSNKAMKHIFQQYTEEIVPLYIDETMLDLRFFAADSPIFNEAGSNSKSKTYAMA